MSMNIILNELKARSDKYKRISEIFRDFVDRMTEDSDLNLEIARSGVTARREADALALTYVGRRFLMTGSFHADMKQDGSISMVELDENGKAGQVIAAYLYDEAGNLYDSSDNSPLGNIIEYSIIERLLRVIYKKVGEAPKSAL